MPVSAASNADGPDANVNLLNVKRSGYRGICYCNQRQNAVRVAALLYYCDRDGNVFVLPEK